MKHRLPLLKDPEDFKDQRSRSLLLKYDLPVEELSDLRQKLYERGKFTTSLFTPEKSSIIKELIASAVLYLETTKRDRFLTPYCGSFIVLPYGEKIYRCLSLHRRKRPIESYEKFAEELLYHVKRLERCELLRYFKPLTKYLPEVLHATIHSISRRCDNT